MPLHRNENSSQKTLSLKGETTYVKENYMLSRERITVFTQVSSDGSNPLPHPEFVFKGKGTRTKLTHPPGIKSHWAPKGSYRLETMLATIANLPNRYNMFSQSNYALYILDDYFVHITDEVKKALLAKGYILVVIGGGITGDIQCNDTHVHHVLKKKYREMEAKKMMEILKSEPGKIPAPSRDDVMNMLSTAWNSIKIDVNEALKQNFITSAFDGSDDYKVRESLYSLVYTEMDEFRRDLLSKPPPKNLKDLTASITPPKGVKRKSTKEDDADDVPPDEGLEIFDCEGDELQEESDEREEIDEYSTDDEDIEFTIEQATSKEIVDNEIVKQMLNGLVDEVIEIEKKNPFSRVPNLDPNIKKDVIFMDRIMEVIESSTTSTTFLPHLLKLKQVCKTGRASLKKRIKAKHELTRSLLLLPNSLESTETITTVPKNLTQSEAGETIDVTEIKWPSETVASIESSTESTTATPTEPMRTEPTETIDATESKVEFENSKDFEDPIRTGIFDLLSLYRD